MRKSIRIAAALIAFAALVGFSFAQTKPVTITLAAGNVGIELQMAKDGAQAYMASHPNVTVNVLDTPDLSTDRLGLYLQNFEAKSDKIDVYQTDVIWSGDLAEHLVDLNQYGAKKYTSDHFPAMIQNNTVNGKLVAMPYFTDAGLLFYRTDLLKKYGYAKPPATWDDLQKMAAKIQAGERSGGNQDFWGYVWQGNSYEGLTCDALEWVFSNGGGTIVDSNGKVTLDNPNAAAALDRAAGWIGTISPKGVTGFGEEDSRNMWQAGNAAFMRNWPYAYSLGNGKDSAIKGKFDVAPLPGGKAGSGAACLGGWQLAVSKYSKNPDIAADFLFFMVNAENQKHRAIAGSFSPTIMKIYKDPELLKVNPFFGPFGDVLKNSVARPSTATAPKFAEVSKVFFTGTHDVLTGAKKGAQAVKEMALDISDLIAK
jgi:trehalose/maltose transport system substrate-binding protein